MNLRLGIYEIFSRIVPGGVYMAAIGQLLSILGVVTINFQTLNTISLLVSVGLIVAAYILGGALDNLALILFRLFKRPKFSARSFTEFKQQHAAHWKIDFGDEDWSILLAYIRTRNLDLAGELDRHNAISIMSRNIGTGLLMIAVNFSVQALQMHNATYLLPGAIMLVFSVLILREAVKFRGWFYNGIYETVLAYRIDLEKSIRPIEKPDIRKKREKRSESENYS